MSSITARVFRYHPWSSSAAAIRAYSSVSTAEEGTGSVRGGVGSAREEDAVDGHFGGRPRLDAETRPAARLATGVDRAAAELGHREHDLAVDARRELVGAQLHLDGVVSVQAGRVGYRRVGERLPVLAVVVPLAHEEATAAVDRVDVERVAREPFAVVDRDPEQQSEARTRREVDGRARREVLTGDEVG